MSVQSNSLKQRLQRIARLASQSIDTSFKLTTSIAGQIVGPFNPQRRKVPLNAARYSTMRGRHSGTAR